MPKGVELLEKELADYTYKLKHHTHLRLTHTLPSTMTEARLRALIEKTEKALEKAKKKGKGGTRRNRPFRLRLSRRFLKW